jgi:hypothetical protein
VTSTTETRVGLSRRLVPLLLAVATLAGCSSGGGSREVPHKRLGAGILSTYARLPLSFEPNVGQSDGRVRFVARAPGSDLLLTPREAVLALTGERAGGRYFLRMRFLGAGRPALSALDPLAGKVNYFVGNDRSRWRASVPTYARVRYAHVWPRIDASFYGDRSRLEYDIRLAPGADPRRIALRFSGAQRERIDSRGALVLTLPGGGSVRELAPVAYQLANGRRHAVASRFVLAAGVVRIALGSYDRRAPLTIDPPIVFSTYLGGGNSDAGKGIAVDSKGNAYITGFTASTNFPTQNPEQGGNGGGDYDVFVTKLNPSGTSILYSTYIGGGGSDQAAAIAVDPVGDAYVTGLTFSSNFPAQNPMQSTNAGGDDAFVTKLSPGGDSLVYSTYMGTTGNDKDTGIAVDSGGNAYVAGQTQSTAAGSLAHLLYAKLHADGSRAYEWTLSGDGEDEATGIAVDGSGDAYITGSTFSTNLSSPGVVQSSLGGSIDAFVAEFDPTGGNVLYLTYLGGKGVDGAAGIVVDASGDAYVTGVTFSSDFPLHNPEQAACGDSGCSQGDAFVAKLSPGGTALLYSTYLGGDNLDVGNGIALDSAGDAYIAGSTSSTNFPTHDAPQPACGGAACSGGDAFVTKLDPAGGQLLYSTYLGGSGIDEATGVAADPSDAAYVIGTTTSAADFPVRNPVQPAYGGGTLDAFVAKISGPDTMAPTSAASVPVCHGAVTVTVTDDPTGSGPQAVHYRLDGGPEQIVATTGNPGTATIPSKEGNHTLEYWGEDATGNQEFPHHTTSVQVDTTPPTLSIIGDQGFSSYEIGDHVSVTIAASDATSGLAADPSQSHAQVQDATTSAGLHTEKITATDRCDNTTTASFAYTVIPNPIRGRNVNLETRAGKVTVKVPGAVPARSSSHPTQRGFVALIGARQVPLGTIVDATDGEVAVTAASATPGHLQTDDLSRGRFKVLQTRAGGGLVELRLIDIAGARTCKRARTTPSTRRTSARQLGFLRSNARGRFRTTGHYSSATTLNSTAIWSMSDRCDGTLTRVPRGRVNVRDFRTHKNHVIQAGHSYLARAP